MPARSRFVQAAVVDDDDDAFEGVTDSLGRPNVSGHIGVLAFRAHQRLVEGVQDNADRLGGAELAGDVGNEGLVIGDKVGLTGHHIERDVLSFFQLVMPTDGLDPLLVAVRALEGAIDNRALLDAPVAILPAHGDVEHQIERPERLEAFRLAPDTDEPRYRNQLINKVELLEAGLHVVESYKLETIATRLLRFWLHAWLCRLEVNYGRVSLSAGKLGRKPIERLVKRAGARGHHQIEWRIALARAEIDDAL